MPWKDPDTLNLADFTKLLTTHCTRSSHLRTFMTATIVGAATPSTRVLPSPPQRLWPRRSCPWLSTRGRPAACMAVGVTSFALPGAALRAPTFSLLRLHPVPQADVCSVRQGEGAPQHQQVQRRCSRSGIKVSGRCSGVRQQQQLSGFCCMHRHAFGSVVRAQQLWHAGATQTSNLTCSPIVIDGHCGVLHTLVYFSQSTVCSIP